MVRISIFVAGRLRRVSVSHSHLDGVANYIRSQPHHQRKSFQEEYVEFLKRHHVPYDQRNISSR